MCVFYIDYLENIKQMTPNQDRNIFRRVAQPAVDLETIDLSLHNGMVIAYITGNNKNINRSKYMSIPLFTHPINGCGSLKKKKKTVTPGVRTSPSARTCAR